mmetsp:Transcript_17069/g.29221  ORF Transcript_17069/g.29221 Transcript_17069/m.29221 type:complete len:133 (-) Transcript_17069:253-651(-)
MWVRLWLLPVLVVTLLSLAVPWTVVKTHRYAQSRLVVPQASEGTVQWYFYNAVTGDTQWVDPGDTPYEGHDGTRYYMSLTGERMTHNPNAWQYIWLEQYSEEARRSFYYNQQTKESTWERPADLAWRRIRQV